MSKKVDNFIRKELERLQKGPVLNKSTKMAKGLRSPVPQPDPQKHSFSKYC
jgi:hypothetical protein